MAPKNRIKSNDKVSMFHSFNFKSFTSDLLNFLLKKVLTLEIFYEKEYFSIISYSLMLFEIILNVMIINRVSYTEIDWSTYMQQVECFLNKTYDYESIKGDTGPIVYPAGHLYIFTLLYWVTNSGSNIKLAQYIFASFYLITLFFVFQLYRKYSKCPPYVLIFMCCTSYRIHSIYVLRLFNDTIAMLMLYVSLMFFTHRKWNLGSIFFSLATSIKMNILLFAPGLFLVYNECLSKIDAIKNLAICAFVQVVLALPFLMTYPVSYIKRSFNLGRVFLHQWTVNYRFLPEQIFVHPGFHTVLLFAHITFLLVIFRKRWLNLIKNLFHNQQLEQKSNSNGNENFILMTMFVSNFVGIAFARSLHYQFYIWYYHSLPFILWNTSYRIPTKICMLGLIELVWNIYPSTVWSSTILHIVHLSILIGLVFHEKSVILNPKNKIE